ncbi:MAG: YdcF family protein [Thermoguttaceae bacterium]|jgi:uncharacterized SAM-binding protein YcdF (DUF218 family)
MSRGRRRLYGLLVVCSVLAGLYVARDRVLPVAARWLDVGEVPRRSDYAVVLGGGANSRPFVAAALVRLGLTRKVLVTRVARSPSTEDGILLPDHELSRRVLLHRGVPAENIEFLGTDNSTTFDEAQALSTLLEAAPDTSFAVVTHGYHTRRARWILSRVLGARISQVSFVSVPTDGFRADNWWCTEDGFATIVGENLKLCFYMLRYDRIAQAIVTVLGIGGVTVLLFYFLRRAAAKRAMKNSLPAVTDQEPRKTDEGLSSPRA